MSDLGGAATSVGGGCLRSLSDPIEPLTSVRFWEVSRAAAQAVAAPKPTRDRWSHRLKKWPRGCGQHRGHDLLLRSFHASPSAQPLKISALNALWASRSDAGCSPRYLAMRAAIYVMAYPATRPQLPRSDKSSLSGALKPVLVSLIR